MSEPTKLTGKALLDATAASAKRPAPVLAKPKKKRRTKPKPTAEERLKLALQKYRAGWPLTTDEVCILTARSPGWVRLQVSMGRLPRSSGLRGQRFAANDVARLLGQQGINL